MANISESSLLASCSNLTDYLRGLGNDHGWNVYQHPATCLAVFRELPKLAQQFVMRLLFVEQPIPNAVVMSWVIKSSSLESLKLLR